MLYSQIVFSTGAVALTMAAFGQGTGPIILDDVRCIGTEPRLMNCQNSGVNNHNCLHTEDAGVRCQAAPPPGEYYIVMS